MKTIVTAIRTALGRARSQWPRKVERWETSVGTIHTDEGEARRMQAMIDRAYPALIDDRLR